MKSPSMSLAGEQVALPATHIEPRRPGIAVRARELWHFRGVVRFLAIRMLRKTYARTLLGRAWIPLRPLMTVVPAMLIFGGVLGAPSNDVPYPLFFLVGMAAWQLFAQLLYWITRSVEVNRRLVKRLYFPRLSMPIAALAPAGVQGAMYALLALMALAYYLFVDGHLYAALSPELLLIPAALALAMGLAYGIGLWLAVFGAQVRDVRFTVRSMLTFWMMFTPVIYPLSAVPSQFRSLAEVNPMTAPVEMVKVGLLGDGSVPELALMISGGAVLVSLASGLWFFGKAADVSIERM